MIMYILIICLKKGKGVIAEKLNHEPTKEDVRHFCPLSKVAFWDWHL